MITVTNPWQGADSVTTRLFISRGGEAAPEGFDGQVLEGDARRIVTMSSTHIAMLDAIGVIDRVVGVSGLNFISNPTIQAGRDSIGDVGYEGNVVIKVNDTSLWPRLGNTAKSPRWAIAYKFKAQRVLTRLHEISFQVGRTGAVTPVANLEAVPLGGTVVKRASLHNADIIQKMDVRIGDFVYVEKGGEVIPKIVGVELSRREPGTQEFQFITHCPECGTALVRQEGEAGHYCPNEEGCPPQIKGKLEHFISRKAMDIDSLGEGKTELLYEKGLVRNVADFYDLRYEDLFAIEKTVEGKEGLRSLESRPVLYRWIRFHGI